MSEIAAVGPHIHPSEGRVDRAAHSLRWYLGALSLGLTLPGLVFTGILLWQSAQAERARLEQDGLLTVRAIAAAVDRDVASLTATLQALAVSPALASGDLAGFHTAASEVARSTGLHVVLSAPMGQQLVNTRVPFGEPLPRLAFDLEEVLATRAPVATDLFIGAVTREPLYALVVPVFRPGTRDVAQVLSFSIDPERLRELVVGEGLPAEAIGTVLDGEGRVLARSRSHEELVGEPAPDIMARIGGRREGQIEDMVSLDGTPVVEAFTRVRTTGWTAGVGTPQAVIDAPLYRLLGQLLGLGALLATLALGLGLFFSRRILTSLAKLRASATAMGHGHSVPQLATPVREVNDVGEAHVRAARELQERADGLRAALEAKEALLYEVNHRVKNSLAVVGSLMALQVRQAQDPALARALSEVRARIDVIAMLHQRLYQTGRHDRVDLGAFLSDIAGSTLRALNAGERFTLELACQPGLLLPVEQATPLAIITSELFTNALKYAHPDGSPGRISVLLEQDPSGEVRLVVADDGVGLPASFDPSRSTGVGMKVVTALCRQVRAELEASDGWPGARFTITLTPRTP